MATHESTTSAHLYSMNARAAGRHVPDHPDRTAWRAYRPILWAPEDNPTDVIYEVWPSREAMLEALARPGWGCWTPWL